MSSHLHVFFISSLFKKNNSLSPGSAACMCMGVDSPAKVGETYPCLHSQRIWLFIPINSRLPIAPQLGGGGASWPTPTLTYFNTYNQYLNHSDVLITLSATCFADSAAGEDRRDPALFLYSSMKWGKFGMLNNMVINPKKYQNIIDQNHFDHAEGLCLQFSYELAKRSKQYKLFIP